MTDKPMENNFKDLVKSAKPQDFIWRLYICAVVFWNLFLAVLVTTLLFIAMIFSKIAIWIYKD